MTESTQEKTSRLEMAAAVAILLIGFAVRVFYAWTMQYMGNEDHCLVGLMAKHMAEGRNFPVFFYGQPYMGSLEPAISAVLVWLFGPTGFMVYLGTALTGLLMLPLLYLFGRDADSRWAGLFAMVYTVIGPYPVLYFYVVPRGGYMTMMVCGIATLWLACRIASRTHADQRVSPWAYAALGLLAGLGWWSNQLVIAFLLTACAVLLLGFRSRMIITGLLPALAGFFLGAAPWFLWNITHGWGSFDFAGTFGKVTLQRGLQSVWEQFLVLGGWIPVDAWISKIRILLFFGILAAYVALLIRDRLKKKDEVRFYYRVALPLLVIVMLLLYSRSHYAQFDGAHRYLLPWVPAFALMVGLVCARLMNRRTAYAGVALLLAVLPAYTLDIRKALQDFQHNRIVFEHVQKLADTLAPQCHGLALGDWVFFHWMNFASGEKLCVANLPTERYAPYGKRAELEEHPAALGNFKRIRTFLEATQGSSTQGNVEEFIFDVDLRPPSNDWRYVNNDQIESAVDHQDKPILNAVTDFCLDTCWSADVVKRANVMAKFTFRQPLSLCGIRFLSLKGHYPTYVSIEGDDGRILIPHQRATGFFWSGDQVKVDGLQYFQEFRFTPPAGGVKHLSISFDTGDQEIPYTVDLAEIRFLEKSASETSHALPSVDSCIAALRAQGLRHFYAPRWLASHVWAKTEGEFDVPIPGNLQRTINDLTVRDRTLPEPVVLQKPTGFVCDHRDADSTRRTLASRGLEWKETPLGRYLLFTITGPEEALLPGRLPAMYWTELGCFQMNNGKLAKDDAHRRYMEIMAQKDSAAPETVIQELRETLREYPGHQPARRALIAELEKANRPTEAQEQAAELQRQTVPEIPAALRFSDGMELLGISLGSSNVTRGGRVEMRYYWKCPPAIFQKKLPILFVHFVKDNQLFQDDHKVFDGMSREEIAYQPFDEVLVQTRQVHIPADTPPGDYAIRIGRSSTFWRVAVETDLPQSQRAVELPVRLTVSP